MGRVWVALLRGINVGGRNRVPMAELRQIVEAAGCANISTYIASGNVVFEAATRGQSALARRLEQAIVDAFGVPARVVLRTPAELDDLVRSHPFGRDTSQTIVAFLAEKPDRAAVRRLEALDVAPDRFELA